ncbi:hypothetical protein C2G38_2033635 [Gigaspora rosea]|uniref:Uncharacterized protein n=1 Tax=Gigaspora rosea TaxID=44941 RepID=A0A397VIT0_9GLOM|nr:hypothetical protein C2G38_2033635 [Gigaspora rosea]
MLQEKLLRHVRYNAPIPTTPIIGLTIKDFIFDPNQHRTQYATRELCMKDKIFYIKKEWTSVPLGPSDCIASKGVKSQEKVFAEELLIETLVQEAALVSRVELPKILPDFLALTSINNEIIKINYVTKVKSKTKDLNEQLWLSLGQYSNTASAHNVEHQECVNTLLQSHGPLLACINEFASKYYGGLYEKLEKLSWGAFGPKLFGAFLMIAINYNTISDYHWDEHDELNSLCFLVALGTMKEANFVFHNSRL